MPMLNKNVPKIYQINLRPEPGNQLLLERYIDISEYGSIWVCILKPLDRPFGPRRIDLVDICLAIDLNRFTATSLLGISPHILDN
jgi:hypothetical protein